MKQPTTEFVLLTGGVDAEIDALGVILPLLESLDHATKTRVISYINNKYYPPMYSTTTSISQSMGSGSVAYNNQLRNAYSQQLSNSIDASYYEQVKKYLGVK